MLNGYVHELIALAFETNEANSRRWLLACSPIESIEVSEPQQSMPSNLLRAFSNLQAIIGKSNLSTKNRISLGRPQFMPASGNQSSGSERTLLGLFLILLAIVIALLIYRSNHF